VLVELFTVSAVAAPEVSPVTVVVPLNPMVLADCIVIAPAELFPIFTDPVLVPVLILVAKLELAFKLIAAPEIVAPN
jgi:hypothetical protein